MAQIDRAEAAGSQQPPHRIAAQTRRDGRGCCGGRMLALHTKVLRDLRALLALVLEPRLRVARIGRTGRNGRAAGDRSFGRRALALLEPFH